MRRRKPDLLLVLMTILGLGVMITSFGFPRLANMDVEAKNFNIPSLEAEF